MSIMSLTRISKSTWIPPRDTLTSALAVPCAWALSIGSFLTSTPRIQNLDTWSSFKISGNLLKAFKDLQKLIKGETQGISTKMYHMIMIELGRKSGDKIKSPRCQETQRSNIFKITSFNILISQRTKNSFIWKKIRIKEKINSTMIRKWGKIFKRSIEMGIQ